MIQAADALREATWPQHRAAEGTAFMTALRRGDLPRGHFVAYLRALSIVHGVVERLAAVSGSAAVQAVWRPHMAKLPWLLADLAALAPDPVPEEPGPLAVAQDLVGAARSASSVQPAWILGSLYVLEGATHGGPLLAPRVQAAYELQGDDGLRYLRNYGSDQPERWRAFRGRLCAALPTVVLQADAIAGARATFDALRQVHESIMTLAASASEARVHVVALNPEAGTHTVPQAAAELHAARVAAVATLAQVPYIQARYGERGERYTHSDGAWLATLPRFSHAVASRQTAWLGRLLSRLGVPRAVLALHLRETAAALVAHAAAPQATVDVLHQCAGELEAAARAAWPAALEAAVDQVEAASHPAPPGFAWVWRSLLSDELVDGAGAAAPTLRWMQTAEFGDLRYRASCEQALTLVCAACDGGPS